MRYSEKAEHGQQHPGIKTSINPAEDNRKKQCKPKKTQSCQKFHVEAECLLCILYCVPSIAMEASATCLVEHTMILAWNKFRLKLMAQLCQLRTGPAGHISHSFYAHVGAGGGDRETVQNQHKYKFKFACLCYTDKATEARHRLERHHNACANMQEAVQCRPNTRFHAFRF